MIVKNEAAIITRCLDSARELIDYWVICDTGSTDGTQDLIRDCGIPGELHERPWRDFGHNRSELMDLARGKADYLLLLDADMTVTYEELPALDADAYMLRHDGDPEYFIKRLVCGDRRWWYVGVTHEYLAGEANGYAPKLDAITVHHHHDGSTRPEKFVRDLNLLSGEYERDPKNTRTVFYLANTLRDLGLDEQAADCYCERAEMGGWEEEVFESLLQAGMLCDDIELLLKAWSYRPQRAEPLYELAWRLRKRNMWQAAYLIADRGIQIPLPDDTLFIRRWVYEWGCLFEFSIAAWWIGQTDASLQACDMLLAEATLPASYRDQVQRNRAYCQR